jgi:hypothetical protein
MPPNTLDVIRHRPGWRRTTFAERAAAVAQHDPPLVGFHHVEAPVDGRLQPDEQVGHLLRREPSRDVAGSAIALLQPRPDVRADLRDHRFRDVRAMGTLDRLRQLHDEGAEEGLLAEGAVAARLLRRRQRIRGAGPWIVRDLAPASHGQRRGDLRAAGPLAGPGQVPGQRIGQEEPPAAVRRRLRQADSELETGSEIVHFQSRLLVTPGDPHPRRPRCVLEGVGHQLGDHELGFGEVRIRSGVPADVGHELTAQRPHRLGVVLLQHPLHDPSVGRRQDERQFAGSGLLAC